MPLSFEGKRQLDTIILQRSNFCNCHLSFHQSFNKDITQEWQTKLYLFDQFLLHLSYFKLGQKRLFENHH